jgi:dipeptidyl aminopeptidase/acylaminoacyl peptidase
MRRSRLLPSVLTLALACTAPLHAQDAPVERQTVGNRVTENVPALPPELVDTLNRYQNTRGATIAGWLDGDCLLIGTRFAETNQAHRVCAPLGMREQITFYPEPIAGLATMPVGKGADGFVFGKDKGGDEFSQLYWYDLGTREAALLTDGKRSQNRNALFADDGKQLAYSSTARNGKDTDVWVRDMSSGQARAVVTEGGSWSALDFSPDGKRLLVMKYVSINEAYPGEVDLASGKLTLFPVDGGKAAFGDFEYAPDGRVYFVSDEPVAGKPSEFRTLRYHDPDSGKPPQELSGDIPWDVEDFTIADDGKHLAYVTNEDGIAKLHVLSLPRHREIKLPALPVGLIAGLEFSPDGKRLAVTLNTATSPSDTYVIDLDAAKLTRWTQSEVGGLDTTKFATPTLVRYPTFDQVDGGVSGKSRRTIPAFYYKPAKPASGGKMPVLIQIHGGPEGQAQPAFSPTIQYLVNELGVAVLVPNVRGSSGYGKTYLQLDNADKREDSVRDIGALLDWIAQQPELDAGRVGVYGGSYGGYMVLATMTNYPQRIRAGVDVVGISHFGTFLKNTEDYRRDLRRAEYGDEREPAMLTVFERISPLNNAKKIAGPLFVAQGRNDPRVPYTEAEQIVKAVRSSGQPVWFLMFDDEGHGFRKKSNNDYFTAASVLFWQRHLLGAK